MEQEKVDLLNKEAIEILGYEKAPHNFTSLVMDRIQRETVHANSRNNPIIGRWSWLLIIIVFGTLVLGLWISSATQSPEYGFLADSFLNDWWTGYVNPVLNIILTSESQFGLVILIGITATALLFADRLLGTKLKNRISYD
jgi:hypothetical protein